MVPDDIIRNVVRRKFIIIQLDSLHITGYDDVVYIWSPFPYFKNIYTIHEWMFELVNFCILGMRPNIIILKKQTFSYFLHSNWI